MLFRSHKPYVYLNWEKMDGKLKRMLVELSFMSGWKINFLGGQIPYVDFYGVGSFPKDHPWSADGCLHQPEPAVLACSALEKSIERLSPNFSEKATIRDGNAFYIEDLKMKHWQYKPSPNWEVTKETWASL